MFASIRYFTVCLFATLGSMVGTADAAGAGWVTIRNDTNQIVVIQEIIHTGSHTLRLKPVRLLPGESVRQSEPIPGIKHFELYDAQRPGTRLWAGDLRVLEANQTFCISITASKPVIREETLIANTPHRR